MNRIDDQGLPTRREVNAIDIVDYLQSIGYQPKRVSGMQVWFLSPLREERTPSFKVDRRINVWFDFGLYQGGSLVALCMLLYKTDEYGVLVRFRKNLFEIPTAPAPRKTKANPSSPTISNLSITPLAHKALLDYLGSRRINLFVARQYCLEAHYSIGSKHYFVIAFPNQAGGFELRNRYFKGCASPKDYTFINRNNQLLCVFEGFFDFLGFLTICEANTIPDASFLILNTVGLLGKCQSVIESFLRVNLYLDQDAAGDEATRRALGFHTNLYDRRHIFRPFKDLSEWLEHLSRLEGIDLLNSP